MKKYYHALDVTDPTHGNVVKKGSAQEKEALEAFKSFYSLFSEDRIRESLHELYAEDAYFRDVFKEVQGLDAIKSYFISSTEPVHECTFDMVEVAEHNGNYYFRWILYLTLKRSQSKTIEIMGMSHVRFNERGKVVFHQDYWDTGALYEHFPIIGSLVRWIKNKF